MITNESLSEMADLDALKAKHGEIFALATDDAEIIIRKPTRTEYRKFLRESAETDLRAGAIEDLVRAVVLVPDAQGFGAMLNELPGLCEEFAPHILKLAGLTGKAIVKKL